MRGLFRNMENYTGSWNWDKKSQGAVLKGADAQVVGQYRQFAEERVDAYTDVLNDISSKLGFPIKIIPPCVKEESSCLRKVWDRNAKNAYGQPAKIIDYLRASIIVPDGPNGIKHLRETMEALISHPLTVAYKDQFWKPEADTGYRSFKALLNIEGHTAELKLDFEGMDVANDMTEYMRNFERKLKEAEEIAPRVCNDKADSFGPGLRKLTGKMEGMIQMIRELRLECHDYYAAKCGLNELLDPAANRELSPTADFAKSVKRALGSGNPLARGLSSMLQRLEGPSVRMH